MRFRHESPPPASRFLHLPREARSAQEQTHAEDEQKHGEDAPERHVREPVCEPRAERRGGRAHHDTAPRLWCARIEDSAMNVMVASEVPIAHCMITPGLTPWRWSSSAMTGTMSMPPPMPSRPAVTPAAAPLSINATISTVLVLFAARNRLFRKEHESRLGQWSAATARSA